MLKIELTITYLPDTEQPTQDNEVKDLMYSTYNECFEDKSLGNIKAVNIGAAIDDASEIIRQHVLKK